MIWRGIADIGDRLHQLPLQVKLVKVEGHYEAPVCVLENTPGRISLMGRHMPVVCQQSTHRQIRAFLLQQKCPTKAAGPPSVIVKTKFRTTDVSKNLMQQKCLESRQQY